LLEKKVKILFQIYPGKLTPSIITVGDNHITQNQEVSIDEE